MRPVRIRPLSGPCTRPVNAASEPLVRQRTTDRRTLATPLHCSGVGGVNNRQRTQIASPMKPITATATRSNRILIALAAAWMILSLAIGGAVSADSDPQQADPAPITRTAQP